jgi:RNA-directed DNA polymerase
MQVQRIDNRQMADTRTNLDTLWRQIEQAGSIEAYVDAQLREHGFLIERRATDNMSARELAKYKDELKKEATEKRRLRAEAWRAYRTQHIVHLGEGIYWNEMDDWDKWDHESAEERAAENELPKLVKPRDLAEALKITIPQLRWLTFHREAAETISYRRFTVPKRDGTERPIWAPLPILKGCQRWILRNVVERLPTHGSVHGFMAGRSIRSNASIHRSSKIVLKMDMKDFFPTLTYRRVKGMFRSAGYREQIATLLGLLCTEPPREIVEHEGRKFFIATGPRCLPQGAPTSPAITNAICLRLDQRLMGLAVKFGWRYTRYADDMTFSLPLSHRGDPSLGAMIGLITKVVADEGFQVHPDKTRIARKGERQTVTGLVVNGTDTPRVPRKLRRQLRAAAHNLNSGKGLKDGESIQSLCGRVAFVAMTNPVEAKRLLSSIQQSQ